MMQRYQGIKFWIIAHDRPVGQVEGDDFQIVDAARMAVARVPGQRDALAFGQTVATFLAAMTSPAGALGLAGQIAFALIPLVRQTSG